MTTTLLEEPVVRPSTSPSQRLRTTMAAVRVSLSWFGVRKTLTAEQKSQAADTFGAEGAFLSAGKKLLDTKHEAYKAVTAVKGRIVSLWKSMSLPYPEPGIRLIRQDQIDTFNTQLETLKLELEEAVVRLDQHYDQLKSVARGRLGSLYNPADYPMSLLGLFQVAWNYPSVEPPEYLQQLSPDLYRQECERVAARFDEAVQLAEQAFMEELQQLVTHLTGRLAGEADNRPKVFRLCGAEHKRNYAESRIMYSGVRRIANWAGDLRVRRSVSCSRTLHNHGAFLHPLGRKEGVHVRRHSSSEGLHRGQPAPGDPDAVCRVPRKSRLLRDHPPGVRQRRCAFWAMAGTACIGPGGSAAVHASAYADVSVSGASGPKGYSGSLGIRTPAGDVRCSHDACCRVPS